MDKILKQLKTWLSKPGNTYARLAAAMGYESSDTVRKWIERGNIPNWRRGEVLDFIKGE